MSTIRVDLTNVTADAIGPHGLAVEAWSGAFQERFQAAHEQVLRWRSEGTAGFMALPADHDSAARVVEVADGFGQWFEAVVVVGIGGSALGGIAIRDALLGPGWNERSDESREHFPRLYFLDNPDPASVASLMDRLDLRRTLFNVVSKSGSTAETLALLLVIEGRLAGEMDEEAVRGHFLFTTDEDAGPLHDLSVERGIPRLAIPGAVGGRFSVLSSVGLLPAAVTGVDVPTLLSGAARALERCTAPELRDNPAASLAVALHALHVDRGCPVHVLMPYADRLRSFGLWFQQLWAESLGKRVDGAGTETGPTPLAALGAVDQHSLLQLLMEGPRDKAVVFVSIADGGDTIPIPSLHSDRPAFAYLGGRHLGELMEAERVATAEALRREGRPSLGVVLERLDEEALGALFMLFEVATLYAGALYGVDPFDQPGVELSKRLAYGSFGRAGYDPPDISPSDPRRVISF